MRVALASVKRGQIRLRNCFLGRVWESLSARTVCLAIAPAWVLMYLFARKPHTDPAWPAFAVGLLALGAAWFGGERFILRQIRVLARAAQRLREGDLTSRTEMARETGEMGRLA